MRLAVAFGFLGAVLSAFPWRGPNAALARGFAAACAVVVLILG